MLSQQQGTVRRFRLADRRRRQWGAASEAGIRWSARYRGARSFRHWSTITPSLYSILSRTFRQWSSSCNIVFNPRWYLQVSLTTQSATFITLAVCWWSSVVKSHKQHCSNQHMTPRRRAQGLPWIHCPVTSWCSGVDVVGRSSPCRPSRHAGWDSNLTKQNTNMVAEGHTSPRNMLWW